MVAQPVGGGAQDVAEAPVGPAVVDDEDGDVGRRVSGDGVEALDDLVIGVVDRNDHDWRRGVDQ